MQAEYRLCRTTPHKGVDSIAGGQPGLKVSWQITAVRQDRYARAHPFWLKVLNHRRSTVTSFTLSFLMPQMGKGLSGHATPKLMKRIKKMRAAATRQQTAALQLSKMRQAAPSL
jgi:hypothetical protein